MLVLVYYCHIHRSYILVGFSKHFKAADDSQLQKCWYLCITVKFIDLVYIGGLPNKHFKTADGSQLQKCWYLCITVIFIDIIYWPISVSISRQQMIVNFRNVGTCVLLSNS
jgi:hypothetical protein